MAKNKNTQKDHTKVTKAIPNGEAGNVVAHQKPKDEGVLPKRAEECREYEKDGALIREAGSSGGGAGISCCFVKRSEFKYIQLTNRNGQSMTIYNYQLDFIAERISEFRLWIEPPQAQGVGE